MNVKFYLPFRQRLCKSFLTLFALLLFSAAAFAQPVTGKVTDNAGKALPDISVAVKGNSGGSVTNASGTYTINAPATGVLVFTGVGFLQMEVPVSGRRNIDVTLNTDVQNLGEIVVTALGIKKESRKLKTGKQSGQ